MNVAQLKKFLEDVDDEAEVLFLDASQCEDDDAGELVPLAVADVDEDADGEPIFALAIEGDEEDDDDDEAPDSEPSELG